MRDFEREYYESQTFWANGALEDARNMRRIEESAALVPAGTRSILDAGCGNGVFVHTVERLRPGMRVLAVDRSRAALEHVRTPKAEGDVTSLPAGDREYDCVTCLEVIEHLPVDAYARALRELTRVADRYVLLGVPYRERTERNVTQCPQCRTIFNVDLHLRRYDDEVMSTLLEEYGFRHVRSIYPDSRRTPLGNAAFQRLMTRMKTTREQRAAFRSPICPLCGYEAPAGAGAGGAPMATRSLLPAGGAKQLVKKAAARVVRLLPTRYEAGYWVTALYERRA